MRIARPRRSVDLGQADPQLALFEDARAPGVDGADEADDPRKASESALDEVETRVAAAAARALSPAIRTPCPFDHDAKGRPVDARQVDGNLDRRVGLEDVDRGVHSPARVSRLKAAPELREDPPDLIHKLAERFRRQDDGLHARSHVRMIAQN